jgi:hypothetical protein
VGTSSPSATGRRTDMRANIGRLTALLLLGFFCDPAVSGQEATDMKLEDAGFIVRVADTPATIARLKTVPARTFIRRVKAGRAYYMYVDPNLCKCVYLGNQDAMNNYRAMVAKRRQQFLLQSPDATLPPGLAPESTMIQDIDADAGDTLPEGDILDFKF